jgi:hypothetical protein
MEVSSQYHIPVHIVEGEGNRAGLDRYEEEKDLFFFLLNCANSLCSFFKNNQNIIISVRHNSVFVCINKYIVMLGWWYDIWIRKSFVHTRDRTPNRLSQQWFKVTSKVQHNSWAGVIQPR